MARTTHSLFMRGVLRFLAHGHNGYCEFWAYVVTDRVFDYLLEHQELLQRAVEAEREMPHGLRRIA